MSSWGQRRAKRAASPKPKLTTPTGVAARLAGRARRGGQAAGRRAANRAGQTGTQAGRRGVGAGRSAAARAGGTGSDGESGEGEQGGGSGGQGGRGRGGAAAAGGAAAGAAALAGSVAVRGGLRTAQLGGRALRTSVKWVNRLIPLPIKSTVIIVLVLVLVIAGLAMAGSEILNQEAARRNEALLAACEQGGLGNLAGAGGTPDVMGSPAVTAAQMETWWEAQDRGEPLDQVSMDELIGLYHRVGGDTGVRGDVAFAQAVHETGWFGNSDSQQRNNFAGIGNTDDRGRGNDYGTPREGVEAHLELLASYADGSGPGQATNWGQVGDDWSGVDSGAEYWALVQPHFRSMLDHAGVASPPAGGEGSGDGSPSGDGASLASLPSGMDLERSLAAIRTIESGSPEGDYDLDNGVGATGAYQFLDGTWGGYEGYDRAKDAPPEVQDARAREHVGEIMDVLDGPWQRELALGWYLGPGPTGAEPFMDMPASDERWDEPRDAFGTTPRGYMQRFQEAYGGASGESGGATTAGLQCGDDTAAVAGPERDAIIQRAKVWLTDGPGGGDVPYSMDPPFHESGYRRDCSGYVSMAWQLPAGSYGGTNTVGLGSTHTVPVAKDELMAGDILLDDDPGAIGHVVIFERWANEERTQYWGYEQAGSLDTEYRQIQYPYGNPGSTPDTSYEPRRWNELA